MHIVERLGWMLFHSGWQILLIACSYGIVLGVFRLRSASARYTMGCIALGLMAVAPAVTFLQMRPDSEASDANSMLAEAFAQPAPGLKSSGWGSEPADETSADVSQREPFAANRPDVASAPQTTKAGPGWIRPVRSALPFAVAIWLAGISFFSFRLILGAFYVLRLRRRSLPPCPQN